MRILYLPNEYSQQRQRDIKAKIYPVLLAMEAEYYRKQGHEVFWGEQDFSKCICNHGGVFHPTYGCPVHHHDKTITEPEGLPFLDLPAPDRVFTRYQDYQDNGNYKYLPATHIQSARDCWYHKCNFCSWAKKYPVCETRSVVSVITEIKECVRLGIKEIFDDSGTFPVGDWLKEFCRGMISTGLNNKVTLGCNMRFGALDLDDFGLMKKAGFRMILWGLESVNQATLDKLNKGIRFIYVPVELNLANKAGLWNHVAFMTGYPWESYEEQKETFDFVKLGLLTNKIKTAQASIYDIEGADTYMGNLFRNKLYAIYHDPRYLWHRIKEIRNCDDVKYYLRGFNKLRGRNGKKRRR